MKLFSFIIAALVGLAATVAVAVPVVQLQSCDEPSNSTDPLICGVLVGTNDGSRQDMIMDIGRRQCRKVNIDANWLDLGVPVDCYFYSQDGCGIGSLMFSAHGPNRFYLGKEEFVHSEQFGRPWYQCEKAGQNSENEIITGLAMKAARAVDPGLKVGILYPRDDSAVQSLFIETGHERTYKAITVEAFMVDMNAGVRCSFHRTSCGTDKEVIIYGPHHKQQQLVDGLKFYICYFVEGVPPPDVQPPKYSTPSVVRDTESEPYDAAYVGELYEKDATVMQSLYLGNEVEGRCRNITIEAYRLDIDGHYTCSFYRDCNDRPQHLIDGPIHKTILVNGLKGYLCDITDDIPGPQDPPTVTPAARMAVRTVEPEEKSVRKQFPNTMTDERKDVAIASLAAEQCKPVDASTQADAPDISCGIVQSWAKIPPFRLTTFPQCSDCNMISYGGVSYNVTAGCTCSFYEMCGGDTLVTVVGPKAGPILNGDSTWARAYTCTFETGSRPDGPQGPVIG